MSAETPETTGLREAVEAACAKSMALTQDVMGTRSQHWRGPDYADGLDNGIETTVSLVREALAAHPTPDATPDPTEVTPGVEALLGQCHEGICPVHNEAADSCAEYEVADLMARIAALIEQARAEGKADADAAWTAKVEALLAKWSGCWCDEQMAPDHDPRVQDCPRHGDGAADHFGGVVRADLRALARQEGER